MEVPYLGVYGTSTGAGPAGLRASPNRPACSGSATPGGGNLRTDESHRRRVTLNRS